jgi:thiol-disulfide isomerase/thioredoxin
MSASTRWTVAVLAVVAALIGALALQLREPSFRQPSQPVPGSVPSQPLAELRARAGLPPCPAAAGAGPGALHGVTARCAADGSQVDVAQVVAGRTVLLNLWAYWCAPCRTELPAMAAYQRRVGSAVTVLTVHQDADEAAALQLLTDLDVRLPTLQDATRSIAAALRVPNVMPATLVLRSDGSVAATLPRTFANADEIAAAIDAKLGVPQ